MNSEKNYVFCPDGRVIRKTPFNQMLPDETLCKVGRGVRTEYQEAGTKAALFQGDLRDLLNRDRVGEPGWARAYWLRFTEGVESVTVLESAQSAAASEYFTITHEGQTVVPICYNLKLKSGQVLAVFVDADIPWPDSRHLHFWASPHGMLQRTEWPMSDIDVVNKQADLINRGYRLENPHPKLPAWVRGRNAINRRG